MSCEFCNLNSEGLVNLDLPFCDKIWFPGADFDPQGITVEEVSLDVLEEFRETYGITSHDEIFAVVQKIDDQNWKTGFLVMRRLVEEEASQYYDYETVYWLDGEKSKGDPSGTYYLGIPLDDDGIPYYQTFKNGLAHLYLGIVVNKNGDNGTYSVSYPNLLEKDLVTECSVTTNSLQRIYNI